MQAIVMTQISGGEPVGLTLGEPDEAHLAVTGWNLLVNRDDYGCYLVSGDEKQIMTVLAVMPGVPVDDSLSKTAAGELDKNLLANINGLLLDGGYHVQYLPGATIQEMFSWFYTGFDPAKAALADADAKAQRV